MVKSQKRFKSSKNWDLSMLFWGNRDPERLYPIQNTSDAKIASLVVSYQMLQTLHLFPKTTSETKTGYSLTPRGVGKDTSKKQQRKKTRELEIAITWFFFFSFSRTGDTKTLDLATTFWERNPTFSKRFLKTLKTYSEEPKNIQIFENLRPFNVVLRKQRPRILVSHTEHIRCQR